MSRFLLSALVVLIAGVQSLNLVSSDLDAGLFSGHRDMVFLQPEISMAAKHFSKVGPLRDFVADASNGSSSVAYTAPSAWEEVLDTPVSLLRVLLLSAFTCVISALGAAPFLFVSSDSDSMQHWVPLSNRVAAGMMSACSLVLCLEGFEVHITHTLLGMALGVAMVKGMSMVLDVNEEELLFSSIEGKSAKKALLFVAVMAFHSVAEGVGLGVSFGGGEELGTFISIAIGIHNVPETLAVCVVLIPRGISVKEAATWGVLSSLPQLLVGVPAYMFVNVFAPMFPIGLGLAAGAMMYLVWTEMLPECELNEDPNGYWHLLAAFAPALAAGVM